MIDASRQLRGTMLVPADQIVDLFEITRGISRLPNRQLAQRLLMLAQLVLHVLVALMLLLPVLLDLLLDRIRLLHQISL